MVIPVDAYLITLTLTTYTIRERQVAVGHKTQIYRERVPVVEEIPPGVDETVVRGALRDANTVFTPAGIEFSPRFARSVTTAAP